MVESIEQLEIEISLRRELAQLRAEVAALRIGLEDALPYLEYGCRTAMSLGGEPARIRFEYASKALSNTPLAAAQVERMKRLEAALSWYADVFNYVGDARFRESPAQREKGQRARDALGQEEEQAK